LSRIVLHLICSLFVLSHSRCVICMCDYELGDELRCLPCMHTFHRACIDDWLMRSLTCPSYPGDGLHSVEVVIDY
uniref:RING-type domain-containing protein n=1 Tax=Schistocephalus solidus TaxID=70667 RepID=A0A183SPH6_SCHSO